jgi:hypothetical protein
VLRWIFCPVCRAGVVLTLQVTLWEGEHDERDAVFAVRWPNFSVRSGDSGAGRLDRPIRQPLDDSGVDDRVAVSVGSSLQAASPPRSDAEKGGVAT